MPKFVDLLEETLRNLEIPEPFSSYEEDLKIRLEKEVNSHLIPIGSFKEEYEPAEFLAVDSSRAIRELLDGLTLGIYRALGITNNGEEVRKLDVEVFYHTGSSNQLRSYESAKMEYLEALVILEYIKNLESNEKKNIVLLDGSLFGRISHLPLELPIDGRELFMIEYINIYKRIFDISRKSNIILVGISKDSRASFFKRLILSNIISELVSDDKVCSELSSILRERNLGLLIRFLEDKVRTELKSKLISIFSLYTRNLPDVYFLKNLSRLDSYISHPIELSYDSFSSRNLISFIEGKISEEEYIKSRFSSIAKEINKEKYSKIELALRSMKEYPTIVSFYVLFNKKDSPLRVDIPSYYFNLDHKLEDLFKTNFLSMNNEEKLLRIVNYLKDQYIGYKNYNVLLKRVDEIVKLSNKVVDKVYIRLIEKKLNRILLFGRDYRRVRLY